MQVVWIYGVPGVGKSTTAWQLYSDLADSEVVGAYIDIDQLGMCYPAREQDTDRHRLKCRALAAVLPNYAAAGAGVLIVSGVLDPTLVDWYVEAVHPAELTFVRLAVDDDELRRRHDERGATPEDWDNVRREARKLVVAQLPHATLETAGLTPREVADAVRAQLGDRVLSPTAVGTAANAPGRVLTRHCSASGTVIWVCGSAGVGKSTVGWATFSALHQNGTTTGYLDLQQLGVFGGQGAGTYHALQAANVASLWGCFRAAGATHLVLSGAVDAVEQVHQYREALPAADVTLFRLRAGREVLARRIRARGRGEGPRLAGDRLVNLPGVVLEQDADRSWLEQARSDSLCIGDVVLDTTVATATQIAARVLSPRP